MVASRIAGALLVAGTLIWGGVALVAQEKGGEYTVVVKKVEVKTTNVNGNSWDVNDGKPDLAVIIRNLDDKDQKTFQTKEKTDAFSTDFNEPTTIKFRSGQHLELLVVDRDVAVNDDIGKFKLETSDKAIKDGKVRMENFGQVIYLEIELKKL
jgi:hypothetical protein